MAQRVRIPHRGRDVLRLPDNSPLWQHFTRGILLCSLLTIHAQEEKVNSNFQKKEENCDFLLPSFDGPLAASALVGKSCRAFFRAAGFDSCIFPLPGS